MDNAAESWPHESWLSRTDIHHHQPFLPPDEGYMSRQPTWVGDEAERYNGLLGASSSTTPQQLDVQSALAHDALQCRHTGCNETFTGEFCEGNLARHQKSVHGATIPSLYYCREHGCSGVFVQKSGQTQHYVTHHSHLSEDRYIKLDKENVAACSEGAVWSERYRREVTLPIELGSTDQLSTSPDTTSLRFVGRTLDSTLSASAPTVMLPWQDGSWTHRAGTSTTTNTRTVDPTDLDSILGQPEVSQGIESSRTKRLTCPKCPGKSFGRQAELRRHMLVLHEGNTSLLCPAPECGRQFSTHRKDKLREHVRNIHKGTVTTNAGSLKFNIPDRNTLKEEEEPGQKMSYICSYCNLEFERQSQLTQHEVRKHIKRYKCEECDKAFNLSPDLERHKKTRHKIGSNMLECPHADCNETFTRQDNLQRHLRKIHGSTSSLKPGPVDSTVHDLLEDITTGTI